MPFKYDKSIMGTEDGKRIYDKWRYAKAAGICDEWKDFYVFHKWVVDSGFEFGKLLVRKDPKKPYSPDNCMWADKGEKGFSSVEWIKKWNKTVNRIRVAYGMEPFKE